MLTVVIPSFYSSKIIEDRINEIGEKIPIIIIENSRDLELKKKLESNFKNVRVIIPEKNYGFGYAANIGIKESKTNMVFISQPDVQLIDNCVDKLIECTNTFKDFTVLTPYDKNDKLFCNYEVSNDYNNSNKSKFNLKQVDFVDLTWLINKDNFDQNDLWDEKIFLYFEAQDFSKRLKNKNRKIYVSLGINTFHIGSASHDKALDFYAKLNKNWHYNWSRFYYNKKHFGNSYAFRKSIAIMYKLIIKYLKTFFQLNKDERKLVTAEIGGLVSSIKNKPSDYRPYKQIVDAQSI